MPSRKARKRYRREVLAEATGKRPGSAGGWGRGVPVDRADIAMIRRAIREGWLVPDSTKSRAIDDLMKAFETAKPRQAIVIAKLFLLMDERNLASENALDASLRAGGSSGDP
jgi:hypothetical protein